MASFPVDPQLYLTYLGVMAVMAVTPGPANLFSVANGVQRGRLGALVGVVGMNAATLVWFGAAALGLGALIVAFPGPFRLISIAGAVYVAWLGVSALWNALRASDAAAAKPIRLGRSAFVDGFLVQLANPKIVLFFSAVLPPFMDVDRPAGAQLALFAAATIGLDVIGMAAYGLGGAALARHMTRPAFRRGFGVASGVLLLAAATLILSRL